MRSLLAICFLALPLWSSTPGAPFYTAESIVNAASYSSSALAPNTIATVFGTNLAYDTRVLRASDMTGGELPTMLGGVTVYVGGVAAALFYVSPTQVNFLLPTILQPGDFPFALLREGLTGPDTKITIHETGPGMFQTYANEVIASHLDGSVISQDQPASAGEWVVLYCVGLGRTSPEARIYTPAAGIAPIRDITGLVVTIDGQPVDPAAIYYAGLTPGFAGLYQINLKLPAEVGTDPEIRLAILDQQSPADRHLPVR